MHIRSEIAVLAKLAAPIALAQFAITTISLVDVAVLGHVSTTELGGAAIGRSIGFAGLALGIGAAAALEPLAAQALGAREPHIAWRAFRATTLACALLWLPCSAVTIGASWLLAPIGVAAELVAPCRAYLVGYAPSLLLFPLFLAAKSLLQAHARVWPAVVSGVIANVVNFVVCNALVRGEIPLGRLGTIGLGGRSYGALGAGVAGSIASFVLVLGIAVAALAMRAPTSPDTETADVRVTKVLRVGMPIGLQILAEIGAFSLVAVLAGRLGKVAVSAHQIAIGLASFSFMGILGISSATAVRVGLAVGEGRSPRQPGLVGIALGAAFMACSSALFLAVPRRLVALFTDDPAIVDVGVTLLGVAAAFQIFDGIQGVAAGALRGAGDVRYPFVANVAAHWLIGFPLALVLAFSLGLGAAGLWWGLLVGLGVVATALAWRFVRIAKAGTPRL